MKSTSQAGIVLVLVMIIIVLASLFWFLYSDYDAAREQADMANSRATRVASMEQEAGQLRAEADQIQATRTALEVELSTLEQESVNDQQTIQALETRVASETAVSSIPEVVITAPVNGETIQLSDSVDLTVAAFDLNGIYAINVVFDNNPPLEIPVGGQTSVTIQEPWPLSEEGEHTAVVTAVNSNNISSQATTVTITIDNKRTSQQIIDEVANIIGPSSSQAPSSNELQVSAGSNEQNANIVPQILAAFDFPEPQDKETLLKWGVYCETISEQSLTTTPVEEINSPAKELSIVQATIRNWQESQYQFSQQLAAAENDDIRAALCALAAGHERWVMEEYIRRMPVEQQAALLENLSPQTGLDTSDIIAIQQTFDSAFGPQFFNAITTESGATAVIEAWNRPPQSTAQILNANEYVANSVPQIERLPDLTTFLGENWNIVTTDVLGAFMLRNYLENFVTPEVVPTAVSGWQGDQYTIYQQDEDGPLLLTLQINWASEQDAQEFSSLYSRYVNGRFEGNATIESSPENSICWASPTEETICLFADKEQTLVVKAPAYNLAVDTLEEIATR